MLGRATKQAGALLLVCFGALAAGSGAAQPAQDVQVRVVLDEAEAAVALLRSTGNVGEDDWGELWETEGFLRYEARQLAFGGTDVRAKLRDYLASDAARANVDRLELALDKWRDIDLADAAARASAYLPSGTTLRATIFPLIKRAPNSFVHDLDTDPAIFIYINPERSRGELENTLAHELHHVGSVLGCAEPAGSETLAPGPSAALAWMSGFGEGMATLAAAGGPGLHPHASGKTAAWAVWERDSAGFATDLRRLDRFFVALADGEIDADADATRAIGMEFINTDEVPQGPFYTVGWRMAALVERTYGRARVVEGVCDPRVVLGAYNEAVAANGLDDDSGYPIWSESLLTAVRASQ